MPDSSNCVACGRDGIQVREVTRSFGHGARLLVIEGIPMVSCPHCGESYFAAETMHGVERIKSLRSAIAVSRSVPVAAFHRPAG
jgi:YgiT-type zinc finger domain-containing protein